MPNVNPGWEERFATLKSLDAGELFTVTISSWCYKHGLNTEEYDRLRPKLRLVEEYTVKMALGMLKGTIKYDNDDRTVEEWEAYEEDDQVDSTNYPLLRKDAQRRQNVAR